MSVTRLALILSPAVLFAACGGNQDEATQRKEPASAPFGFELAMAGVADTDFRADDRLGPNHPPAHTPAPMIDLSPEHLAERLAAGNIRLIDVRSDEEVAAGVIAGAEHIPLDRFDPAGLGPDDGRDVVLYCRSGRRSAIAGEKLAAVRGKPVEHLTGGTLAWEAAGLPLEQR